MTVFLHHSKDGKVDHLNCDDHQHKIFHSYDSEADVDHEERRDDDERAAEDAELAKAVSGAVCDALRKFRAGKDSRSGRDEELEKRERNLDARERARDAQLGESRAQSTQSLDRVRPGRDALHDPADPRRDFRSGDGRSRATADSRRGMALDRARAIGEAIHGQDASPFTHRTVDLSSIFPAQHPHADAVSADVNIDSIFGRH
jgi:hypothetical protein